MDVLRNLFKDDFAAKLDEGIAIGRDEGIAIGRDEGIAIGKNEGIAIGIARERQAVIERLIAIGWSAKEAADFMGGTVM